MLNDASPLQDTDFLGAILDLLIPPRPDRHMPGPAALGLAGAVGADLSADPRSGPPVELALVALREAARQLSPEGFLALSGDDRLAVFKTQLPEHPALVPGLTFHLYLAYYAHPTVLAALNQPARAPFPEGYEIEQTDPELLALLESRRQPTPDA
jgi:hypothetical protein